MLANGKAKIGHLDANDIPTVSIVGKEFPAPVRNIMMGYKYNLDDMRKAIKMGLQLDAEKGMAVRRAINETEESVAFSGDATYLLPGLFTAPNILVVSKPSAGTWDAANTPDEIIADINALFGATFDATRGQDVADTLVVGTKGYKILAQKYQASAFKDDTIMSFLLRTNVFCKRIEHSAWLDDLGASAKERIFVYKKNPSNVALVIPLEFEQLAPQLQGFTFHVPCRSKIGGLMVRKPKSVAYMDGVIVAAGLTGGISIG
jgi:hypothetical protein